MLTKDQILERALQPGPISIVRIGDGESLVLNALSSISALQLCNTAVLQRQLGYSPSVTDIEAIRRNLIEAYTLADIIGIPCHRQKTNSHWAKVLNILTEFVPDHPQVYFNMDIFYEWLDDDSYDKLLQDRPVLNYISCRDLDKGFKNKWNIGTVNKYQIAPEAKFTSGYDGEVHYPTQFNRIPRWMDVVSHDFPGSLLLVGAGVIGKIYCNWWRDRGGVTMDIGGVFDLWAGRVTRGPERGLDVEDLTYKL